MLQKDDVSFSEILFGSVVIAGFLAVAYVIGRVSSAWTNRRFTQAWSPLVRILDGGTLTYDKGAAVSSTLHGTWKGHRVRACMSPERNRYSFQAPDRFNEFDVTIEGAVGDQDWTLRYDTKVLGVGHDGWKVTIGDAATQARVEAAGVVAALAAFGTPKLEYFANTHSLRFTEDVTPRLVPTPERFRATLDLLVRLRELPG
jgi:hypothetical protein